jgi:hypothetical protein
MDKIKADGFEGYLITSVNTLFNLVLVESQLQQYQINP